jgi:hypothetical protein
VEDLMDRLKGAAMSVKPLIEGFGEVLQQVKAIGHLDGVGGTLSGPLRIGSGPIPSDHADAGMGLQPEGAGLGLTIGPEGERPPPFEIDPHGPRGLALAIRPLVDTEHVRRGHIWEGQMTPQV